MTRRGRVVCIHAGTHAPVPGRRRTHLGRRVNRGGRCSNAEWKTGRVDVAAVANRYKNIRHCLRCLKPVTVYGSATETLLFSSTSFSAVPLRPSPSFSSTVNSACRRCTLGKTSAGREKVARFPGPGLLPLLVADFMNET